MKLLERNEIILDIDDYDDREIVPSEYWIDGKVPDNEDVSYYWHLDGEDVNRTVICNGTVGM